MSWGSATRAPKRKQPAREPHGEEGPEGDAERGRRDRRRVERRQPRERADPDQGAARPAPSAVEAPARETRFEGRRGQAAAAEEEDRLPRPSGRPPSRPREAARPPAPRAASPISSSSAFTKGTRLLTTAPDRATKKSAGVTGGSRPRSAARSGAVRARDGRHHRLRLLLEHEVAGGLDPVDREARQALLQQRDLGGADAALVGGGSDHETDRAAHFGEARSRAPPALGPWRSGGARRGSRPGRAPRRTCTRPPRRRSPSAGRRSAPASVERTMPSIRRVPPKSLIRKAKRIARRKPGVAAASVGPPSRETMALTRRDGGPPAGSAIDAATEWATTIACVEIEGGEDGGDAIGLRGQRVVGRLAASPSRRSRAARPPPRDSRRPPGAPRACGSRTRSRAGRARARRACRARDLDMEALARRDGDCRARRPPPETPGPEPGSQREWRTKCACPCRAL